MIKFFSLFLLASTLLFSGCWCGNGDMENGPKSDNSSSEETSDPKFVLSLKEGVKEEELNANQPIPLVLKDENFKKHPDLNNLRIWKGKVGKGTLHLLDAQGKVGEKLFKYESAPDEVAFKDGELPLMFVPSGQSGKELIGFTLLFPGRQPDIPVQTELNLKSLVSLELPGEVKTSKPLAAYLKINVPAEEEYTLKSVKIDSFPVEIFYDNGETEGTLAEIKPVQLGDKFKGGSTELSLKLYGVNDKLEAGPGIFEPLDRVERVDKWKWQEHPKELELVLVDSKGNEYTTKAEIKVEDISWDFDLEPNFNPFHGDMGFSFSTGKIEGVDGRLSVKFKKDGSRENSGEGKYFKVLSLKANDGSLVSLVQDLGPFENVIGKTINHGVAEWMLFFNFQKMLLNPHGLPTVLTLKLEGPGGIVKSADLEFSWAHRELMLSNRVCVIRDRANSLCIDMTYNSLIEKTCQKTIEFLEEVKIMMSQVGDYKLFSQYLQPSTIKELEDTLEAIEDLKGWISVKNKKFGFTFVSPI